MLFGCWDIYCLMQYCKWPLGKTGSKTKLCCCIQVWNSCIFFMFSEANVNRTSSLIVTLCCTGLGHLADQKELPPELNRLLKYTGGTVYKSYNIFTSNLENNGITLTAPKFVNIKKMQRLTKTALYCFCGVWKACFTMICDVKFLFLSICLVALRRALAQLFLVRGRCSPSDFFWNASSDSEWPIEP